jgi:acyl carrier protein
MSCPTFEELADFIREWGGIGSKKVITPEALFEKDLGVTGDDGQDLLEAVEKRFDVCLDSDELPFQLLFNLGPNEVLFNLEGLWFVAPEIITIFGPHPPSPGDYTVRSFTVGELYEAISRAIEIQSRR